MKRSILALVILSAMASPALAATEVSVNPTVTINEAGAQATVSLNVQCPFDYTGFLSVELVQVNKGGKVFVGTFDQRQINCAGASQTLEFTLFSSIPYKAGPATVRAWLDACDPSFSRCEFDQTAEQVKIVNQ